MNIDRPHELSKVFALSRVSSLGQSLESQNKALAKHGYDELLELKLSGKAKRHEKVLGELLSKTRKGDLIIVTKLDRLARSLSMMANFMDALREKGVFIRVLEQGIDTSVTDNVMSKAMTQMLGVFAEMEAGMIKQRLADGKEHARAKNPERTDINGGRKFKLDRKAREDIKEAFVNGANKSELARKYNVSRQVIMSSISRPLD